MKRFFIAFILALSFTSGVFAEGKSVPAPFTRGVNFSEWLEFKNADQVDPYYMTKEDFENVKAMGCDVVRLPVHFETLSSGSPDYTLDPIVFEILDKVVEWSTELKLYVIFDFHNDTGNGSATGSNVEKLVTSVWKQVSEHYAGKGPYICFEVYNEPHYIDVTKWGKIESKVIDIIRKSDADRWIVVGGAEWNSFSALKALPKWNDSKLIYTFHFYEPMLFTHQGADWCNLERVKGIPFPYDEERMPKLPSNPTGSETYYLSSQYNYSKRGTEKAVADFFDQYVKFSQEKNAPVYCGEFGVYLPYANPSDRANWYRIVTNCLDDRGIAHTSWDYYSGFGVFKTTDSRKFPEELNREVVEALGLTVPKTGYSPKSWFTKASETGDYTIYRNGLVQGINCPYAIDGSAIRRRQDDDSIVMEFNKINAWESIYLGFREIVDLSSLVNEGACLEFYAKTDETNLKYQIFFQDSIEKNSQEWRALTEIDNTLVPADGQWHKISVPLKKFSDIGAWDLETWTWVSSQNVFDWSTVDRIVFANTKKKMKKSLWLKDIRIVK